MLAGRNRVITKRFKTKNIAKHIDEYELDPLAQVNAFEQIDRLSLDLLGVYHSHPHHPALPSLRDREYALTAWSYLIIACPGGKTAEIRSWQLHDDGRSFVEQRLSLGTHPRYDAIPG